MITTLPIRVLLVEDNAADARLLREYLVDARAERFEVMHVDRVASAEQQTHSAAFDVVLLDLSLPDGVGLETVTRMLRVAPSLPIVVLTGTDDDTLALRTVQAGAQDYLVKNEISPHLLVRTLRYAIGRRKALDAERREAEAASMARRSHFLLEGGRALASSLDFDTLLRTVGRLVVPKLADLCYVDLVDESAMRRTALSWPETVSEQLARRLESYPPLVDDTRNPSVEAMRSGRLIAVRIDEALLGPSVGALEHRRALNELDARSAVVVPLEARGRIFGTLVTLAIRERPPADAETQSLLEELTQHAALALDNAILYRRQQQAVSAREEIINVVSHDLRNPLNVITLTVSLLKLGLQGHAALQHVERIERSVNPMLRLIDDLLDVARIEKGTFSVEPRSEAAAAIIDAAGELMRPLAAGHALTLTTTVADGLPEVAADRARILQVLSNLIGNAIKFTPSGGRIDVTARRSDIGVRFEVSDTGPGIPPEHRARVFDRFWQARRNDSRGAGLGLAIAKAIVDAHQGGIGVESELGRGTCFFFTLPPSPAPGTSAD